MNAAPPVPSSARPPDATGVDLAQPLDDESAAAILAAFGRAFFRRDREALARIVTPDVEWDFAVGADAPGGRVRRGVDGLLAGIAENDVLFERLRFEDVVARALAPDTIVMRCVVDGRWRGGAAFRVRGVELITVREGRIARKDVYWKQPEAAT